MGLCFLFVFFLIIPFVSLLPPPFVHLVCLKRLIFPLDITSPSLPLHLVGRRWAAHVCDKAIEERDEVTQDGRYEMRDARGWAESDVCAHVG